MELTSGGVARPTRSSAHQAFLDLASSAGSIDLLWSAQDVLTTWRNQG
jgi:hypothetical protein